MTPAPNLLADALRNVISWAQQRCPCENETPDPCPLCDATVAAGRCKAVDATFPQRLLADMRAALDTATHASAQQADDVQIQRWLKQFALSLNRRAEVEQELLDIANGKVALPSKGKCKELALKLGIPDTWRNGELDGYRIIKIAAQQAGTRVVREGKFQFVKNPSDDSITVTCVDGSGVVTFRALNAHYQGIAGVMLYKLADELLAATLAQPTRDGAQQGEPATLMDEPLIQYAHRMRIEACSAWSAVMRPDGTLDKAKCEYARAIEDKLRGAIDEIYALRSATPASVPAQGDDETMGKDESAWLVECPQGMLNPYFAGMNEQHNGMGFCWFPTFTADHLQAVRFSRKEDAEKVAAQIATYVRGLRAVEHGWIAASNPIASSAEGKGAKIPQGQE